MPRIYGVNSTETNSFGVIQPDSGTSPTATQPNATLTFTSSDGTVTIIGNSVTNTVNFKVASSPAATSSFTRSLLTMGG